MRPRNSRSPPAAANSGRAWRGLAGGLLVPGDVVAYPPPVTAFLLEEAVRLGAMVRRGSPVVVLSGDEGHGPEVRLADGTRLRADVVLVATGAEAPARVGIDEIVALSGIGLRSGSAPL